MIAVSHTYIENYRPVAAPRKSKVLAVSEVPVVENHEVPDVENHEVPDEA